jgi:hypothetical protein
MIRGLAMAGVLLGPAGACALVQGVAGFSRARPIVRTASDAPTATIRQLRFNNDSQNPRLYSAGDDKIVRCYSIAPRTEATCRRLPWEIGWPSAAWGPRPHG